MKIEVVVLDAEQYGPGFPDATKLNDFIAWAHQVRATIPAPYRPSATIEITSNSGYEGSSYANIKIAYQREETKQEREARAASSAAAEARREGEERALYARLSKKFGQPTIIGRR